MSEVTTADPEVSLAGHPDRRKILGICCLSLLLVVLAVSSLNIALPELQQALGSSAGELLWIVDIYALVFAGTLLPAGALGDRFGRRGALLLGLGLFGSGALFAGLSSSAGQLIAARALMGVGAGFVMPATLSIIATVFPPQERAKAIATWAGFAGAGGALGPVTSGLVLRIWSWSAVFFISLPVLVVVAVLVARSVPTSRDANATKLDPIGAVLSVMALFSLLFGIIEGPESGWGSAIVVAAGIWAAVSAAAFIWWELRAPDPMLDPRLFKVGAFRGGTATITLIFFVTFGMFFLVAQYLQFAKGYTPLVAGVAMIPSGITLILVAPRAPALASRIGPARSVAVGLLVSAVGFAVLSQLEPSTPYVWLGLALILMAFGSALAMPPSTTAIVGAVPRNKAGVGSAVNDVTREVGGALGIAVLGSLVTALYRSNVASAAQGLPEQMRHAVEESIGGAVAVGGTGDAALVTAAREAFTSATSTAFLIAALLMAVGSAMFWNLSRRPAVAAETGTATVPVEPVPDGAVPCCR